MLHRFPLVQATTKQLLAGNEEIWVPTSEQGTHVVTIVYHVNRGESVGSWLYRAIRVLVIIVIHTRLLLLLRIVHFLLIIVYFLDYWRRNIASLDSILLEHSVKQGSGVARLRHPAHCRVALTTSALVLFIGSLLLLLRILHNCMTGACTGAPALRVQHIPYAY